MRAFGSKFRSSAIAQEKTGEAWVNGLMLGTPVRGDFEHCEVAVFVGKNPWQSHSFPLRVSPADAARLGVDDGEQARLTTKRATAIVAVAVDPAMAPGHLALPNGLGLDHLEGQERVRTGAAPNEFTASEDCDPWVGTPWHKSIPARLEAIGA